MDSSNNNYKELRKLKQMKSITPRNSFEVCKLKVSSWRWYPGHTTKVLGYFESPWCACVHASLRVCMWVFYSLESAVESVCQLPMLALSQLWNHCWSPGSCEESVWLENVWVSHHFVSLFWTPRKASFSPAGAVNTEVLFTDPCHRVDQHHRRKEMMLMCSAVQSKTSAGNHLLTAHLLQLLTASLLQADNAHITFHLPG